AIESITENGFCQATLSGRVVDVFLPTLQFYDSARDRRRRVELGGQSVTIWDAETMCVFKMMFFRRKDIADLEQLLRLQGSALDGDWVLARLVEIYGERDLRVSQWKELAAEHR